MNALKENPEALSASSSRSAYGRQVVSAMRTVGTVKHTIALTKGQPLVWDPAIPEHEQQSFVILVVWFGCPAGQSLFSTVCAGLPVRITPDLALFCVLVYITPVKHWKTPQLFPD